MPNNDTPQNWGYLLTGQVSENLIRTLEGQEALNNYSDENQYNTQLIRNQRATELILDILGVETLPFYVRRFSSSQSAPFENWELTLATDTDDFIFPDKLRNRNQTLQLWTSIHISGRGCLTVRFIRFVDIEEGNIDALVY